MGTMLLSGLPNSLGPMAPWVWLEIHGLLVPNGEPDPPLTLLTLRAGSKGWTTS